MREGCSRPSLKINSTYVPFGVVTVAAPDAEVTPNKSKVTVPPVVPATNIISYCFKFVVTLRH